MALDYSGSGEPVPVCEIRADEITTADTFPSHDGWAHHVEGVLHDEAGIVHVNVQAGARSYSVEFEPGHVVRVLA